MSARRVGKGRGAVYAGGRWYAEGATIPDDVKVGAHVFTDVEATGSNVPPTVDTVPPAVDRADRPAARKPHSNDTAT